MLGKTVGLFTGRVIAAALTVFGATGLLATYLGARLLTGALAATANAVLVSTVAWILIFLLYRQQATTESSVQALLGRSAEVSVAISETDPGYIDVRDATGLRQLLARSHDRSPIPVGQTVRIVAIAGTVVIVEPLHQFTQPDTPKSEERAP